MEDISNEEVKTQKSMNSNSIYYALIVSAAMIVYGLIMYVAGLSLNKFTSYPSYLLMIAGMIMGTIAYRDKHNNRFLNYGKSFTSSFLIGLYASIIGAIWVFIFFKFIAPELLVQILEKSKDEIMNKSPNLSEEQLQMQMSMVQKFVNPLMMVFWTLLGGAFYSAIFSLIIAIFVKKEETTSF